MLPGWDRNLTGGCAWLLPRPLAEDPAPPLPGSRELGDASKGIETPGLVSCGHPMELSTAPEHSSYSGPGAGTNNLTGRAWRKGALNFVSQAREFWVHSLGWKNRFTKSPSKEKLTTVQKGVDVNPAPE